MTRRRGQFLLATGLAAFAGRAACQTFTPNTVLLSPPEGHLLAEAEIYWNRAAAFIGNSGERNTFPGSLGFGLADLRVSYSPLEHFAAGVEVPVRTYRYQPDAFGRTVTGTGLQGLGLFVDWHPSGPAARLAFEARAEVVFAFDGHASPLAVSDGVRRYVLAFQLFSDPDSGLLRGWRLDAQTRLELENGPNTETEDHYAEWDIVAHAGPLVARAGSADILILAVGGYRRATSARQEGNIFGTPESFDALAGGMVSVHWPGQGPGSAVELSVTREIGIKNSLDGWRGTASFRHAF